VLAAGIAELGELKPAGGGLLVLGGGVVPVLACRTLQGDDLAHWVILLYIELASHLGWQAACWVDRFCESAHLTRRDTGLLAPAANPDFLFGKMCGQATHSFFHYPRKRPFGEADGDELGAKEVANRSSPLSTNTGILRGAQDDASRLPRCALTP
jgi:hypothetical protein